MTVSPDDFPIGIENFEDLRNAGYVYVDKTSYLKDLLNSSAAVLLLLRPRRFGKTLSMSMIEKFVEMNYLNPEDRSRQEKLFKDLAVYDDAELCDEYMGRFPVVSISLKDVEGGDFIEALFSIKDLLRKFFKRYRFLLNSDKQDEGTRNSLREKINICSDDKLNPRSIENKDKIVAIASDSLAFITEMLYDEYGVKSIILVDEMYRCRRQR